MSRDRIGISSACWYPDTVENSLVQVGRAGFRTCEIFVNTFSELSGPLLKKQIEIRDHYGLQIKSIHPFTSFAESSFLFSTYERRFYDSLDFYRQYFAYAAALEAKILVIHGMKSPNGLPIEVYAERFAKLIEVGREYGIDVCHENVAMHCGEDPDYLAQMRRIIGSDFHTVLDTKQAKRAGFAPQDFLRKTGDSIRHIHISDYDDRKDCIPPFEGRFDTAGFLTDAERTGYTGDYIIELYRWGWTNASQLTAAGERLRKKLAAVSSNSA